MTSTEVVDRFAHVAAGRTVAEYNDYTNINDGIWTGSGYVWCGAQGPVSNCGCSRPQGHPASWAHIACSATGNGGTVHEVWGGGPLLPDPHAAVTVGTTSDYSGWSEIYQDTNWCAASDPTGGGVCSRPRHASNWQHIASIPTRVIAVWGGANAVAFDDPFASIYVDARFMDYRNWDDNVIGVRVRNAEYCRETKPGVDGGRFCTRAIDHQGQHISTSGTRVLWTMPQAVPVPEPVVEPDPEDGSPVDDESLVFTVAPEIGDVVKLRDRKNRLYVMSRRRDTPEVEVLDLERKELRAIPIDRCVKQDDPLTIDELQWVAQWYSGHRDEVRKVAVREYRQERWCMAGLNENLRSLGLVPYEPTLRGTVTVSLPFDCGDIHAGQDELELRVKQALADPEVSAALRVALPLIDGIELQPDEMTVRATNFTRK